MENIYFIIISLFIILCFFFFAYCMYGMKLNILDTLIENKFS